MQRRTPDEIKRIQFMNDPAVRREAAEIFMAEKKHTIEQKIVEEKQQEEDEQNDLAIATLVVEDMKQEEKKSARSNLEKRLVRKPPIILDKKLVAATPGLLLHRGTVVDYSGRTIEGTAYQLALGADDRDRAELDEKGNPVLDEKGQVQILHKDEGIADMLKGYFPRACDNDEKRANAVIHNQEEQQYPGGYAAYQNSKEVKDKKANDVKALHEVIASIGEAKVSFVNGTY